MWGRGCGFGVGGGDRGRAEGEIWDRRSRVPPEGWALPVPFWGGGERFVDSVLALGGEDALGRDLGPTESGPSGGMGSGWPIFWKGRLVCGWGVGAGG